MWLDAGFHANLREFGRGGDASSKEHDTESLAQIKNGLLVAGFSEFWWFLFK